jgi:phage host-nuclease inhibitor protein Gam
MNRLSDTRSPLKSLDQADLVVAELSKIDATIELEKARAKSKIATIKSNLAFRLIDLTKQRGPLINKLSKFIEANTDLFKKPRRRKTETGEYGLQKVTEVLIDDEADLLAYLEQTGLEHCIKRTSTPIKAEIEKLLKSGIELPGCALISGDTVVYKPSSTVIKDAKQRGAA